MCSKNRIDTWIRFDTNPIIFLWIDKLTSRSLAFLSFVGSVVRRRNQTFRMRNDILVNVKRFHFASFSLYILYSPSAACAFFRLSFSFLFDHLMGIACLVAVVISICRIFGDTFISRHSIIWSLCVWFGFGIIIIIIIFVCRLVVPLPLLFHWNKKKVVDYTLWAMSWINIVYNINTPLRLTVRITLSFISLHVLFGFIFPFWWWTMA